MWKLSLRNLRANLTRLVATAVAVIAGTAFVSTGLTLTQAIGNAVSGNVQEQYGAVDAAVTPVESRGATVTGVPASVLPEVAALPEVAGSAGELRANATILDSNGDALRSQMIGRSWITDAKLNPFTVVSGSAPASAGQVAVDRGTAEAHHLGVGDDVTMATPSGRVHGRIVGVTAFGQSDSADGGGTVFFSPEQALTVLGAGSDEYTQILLRTDGPEAALVRAVRGVVPTNVDVESGTRFRDKQVEDTQAFLDFLRPLLLGFAFLALFVAAFVIYNTFSVVVTQRTRELALIRSVGGTPGQVRRSLLAEGLVLGAVAGTIGLAAGLLFSLLVQWILRRFDLPLPSAGIALTPGIVVITLVSGVVITVVAVMVPAYKAGRTKPVEAMRSAEVDTSGSSRFRLVFGGVLLVAGIALLVFNRFVTNNGIVLGIGALLLFLGVVVGGPLLARLFGRGTKALLRGTLTGRLAADNLVRNPKRTSTTANALVIGLFLVTLVTVSGTAFRDWAMGELAKLSSSDYLVVGATPIPDQLVTKIRDTKGVDTAAAVRAAEVTDSEGNTATLSGADVADLVRTTGMKADQGSLDEVAAGRGMAVTDYTSGGMLRSGGGDATENRTSSSTTTTAASSTTTTEVRGRFGGGPPTVLGGSPRVGDHVGLVDPEGNTVEIPVVATLQVKLDTIFVSTLVSNDLFTKVAGDQPVAQVFIRADPDQVDQVGTRLERELKDYTGIVVEPGNFIGRIFGQVIDFLIAAVNGLLALSVIIALIGIVNTMNLSIYERRRELGMVRALGMTEAQVKAMVRTEAFMIGILGTVIGMVSGIFLGWMVVASITKGGIGLDWGRVGIIFAAGVLISVLSSLWPARQSVKVEMLEAMAAT